MNKHRRATPRVGLFGSKTAVSQGRFLGYGRQLVDDDDIAAVIAVLKGDHLTQGPEIERFEQALAQKVGARHAVAVTSGSAALHVACLAAGVGPGSVALVPNITFVATANAVVACGGEVITADIDRKTIGLAADAVPKILEQRPDVSLLLPVHMAGLAGDMATLRRSAGNRLIVEDAAHALGGYYADNRSVGCCAYSDLTCFSFHPVKPITAGEGGAITTNDDELARRLRLFRNHGIERDPSRFATAPLKEEPWLYEQQFLGFNYRLSDIHAALAHSQLSKLDRYVARRREIAARYDAAFQALPNISLPQADPKQRQRSAHHLYVVEIDFAGLGQTRAQVMKALAQQGLGSQVHYIPLRRQPYYQPLLSKDAEACPNAEAYYSRCLSLPLHQGLTDEEVGYVIRAVKRTLRSTSPHNSP